MKKILFVFVLFFAFLITAVQAQIYGCKINGKIVYTNQPCNGSVEKEKSQVNKTEKMVEKANPQSVAIEQHDFLPNARKPEESISALEMKYFILDDEVYRLEKKLEKLEQEFENEINRLERKKYLAMNNLAGATWEQSISTEIQATGERYIRKIDRKIVEIDRKKEERSEIKDRIKEFKKVYY